MISSPSIETKTASRHFFLKRGMSMRILVVDDNKDMTLLVALLLERQGHEVAEAHDAGTALWRIQQFEPEVVVLDIGLPGMDGCDVAAAIRGDPDGPQPRLIALTGLGETKEWRRAFEVGFDECLVKPMRPQALLAAINLEWPGEALVIGRGVPEGSPNKKEGRQ